MNTLLQRLDLAEQAIAKIVDKSARRDLMTMVKTVDRAIVAADIASVDCRRLRRETLVYQNLMHKATELVSNLEHHVTFAILLRG